MPGPTRFLLLLLLTAGPLLAEGDARSAAVRSIRGEDAMAHVRVLASDEMEGRGLATPGGRKAAEYVAKAFLACGLRPVRAFSRIDCCARIGKMPSAFRTARMCPGVAGPIRSPQPAERFRPRG